MILTPTRVSTKQFTFDKASRTFYAEASDLGKDFRLGRVYDDACDEGFTLVSHKTGKEIVFATHHEERDAEGELQLTEYVPAARRSYAPFRVVIFND